MVGWLILFASMAVPAGVMIAIGEPATVSIKSSGVVFALLFTIGILTRMVRGRVW
jgi:hypothetical protein